MEKYREWDILNEMPEGWGVDDTAGSPLSDCVFITNKKSILNGGRRALLRIERTPHILNDVHPPPQKRDREDVLRISSDCPSGALARTLQELARKRFEERILIDIRADMMVCEVEGWDKLEYIHELKALVNSIGGSHNKKMVRTSNPPRQKSLL